MLYPGDERETLIKPTRSKQRTDVPGTQKKHLNQTDERRSKEKSQESGQTVVGRSNGNVPRVTAESCSVRGQLGGLRFDKALPGDKRLA